MAYSSNHEQFQTDFFFFFLFDDIIYPRKEIYNRLDMDVSMHLRNDTV